jgi:hypothetical protein
VLRDDESSTWIRSIPSRRQVFSEIDAAHDPSKHLIFFLQQTEILPRSACAPRDVSEAAMGHPTMHPWRQEDEEEQEEERRGAGGGLREAGGGTGRKRARRAAEGMREAGDDYHELREDDGDDGPREDEADLAAQEGRARGDVVVLTGVTADGLSVAVRVSDWSIPIYVMPCNRLVEHRDGVDRLVTWIRILLGNERECTVELQHKPRAYGYCPDAKNPAQRQLSPVICIRFYTQKTLRWRCHQLSKILAGEMAMSDVKLAGPHAARLTLEDKAAREVDRILETHRIEPLPQEVQDRIQAIIEREQAWVDGGTRPGSSATQ